MGYSFPFLNVGYAYKYFNLNHAYEHLMNIGKEIVKKNIPRDLCPFIIGVTGAGRCANGVFEVLQQFNVKRIRPEDLEKICEDKNNPVHRETIYVTCF